jgi:hypothetical protein
MRDNAGNDDEDDSITAPATPIWHQKKVQPKRKSPGEAVGGRSQAADDKPTSKRMKAHEVDESTRRVYWNASSAPRVQSNSIQTPQVDDDDDDEPRRPPRLPSSFVALSPHHFVISNTIELIFRVSSRPSSVSGPSSATALVETEPDEVDLKLQQALVSHLADPVGLSEPEEAVGVRYCPLRNPNASDLRKNSFSDELPHPCCLWYPQTHPKASRNSIGLSGHGRSAASARRSEWDEFVEDNGDDEDDGGFFGPPPDNFDETL